MYIEKFNHILIINNYINLQIIDAKSGEFIVNIAFYEEFTIQIDIFYDSKNNILIVM
jgi:hypothetical protein